MNATINTWHKLSIKSPAFFTADVDQGAANEAKMRLAMQKMYAFWIEETVL
jgi:hypothetical protein